MVQSESDRLFIKQMTHIFTKDFFPFRSGEVISLTTVKEKFKTEIFETNSVRELTQEDRESFIFKDHTRYGD